jgi:hypothetical protein
MQTIEFNGDRFPTTEAQAEEVTKWRTKYGEVTELLGRLGTEVKISRTLETDADIAPHQFVRGAVHEFIFPPQPLEAKKDLSEVIDPVLPYNLVRKDITYAVDEALIEGHLRLWYDDAESRISFQVVDVLSESTLDPEVANYLEGVRSFTREQNN